MVSLNLQSKSGPTDRACKALDIVTLIENNPIIKLNGDYQSKLVNKIKNIFTDTQQQLFVSSFYCYLNYDQASDFVVKLNDVWKWVGFGRIGFAKTLLEKNFVKDVDYVVENLITANGGIKHGGDRKSETITMTIRTFKKFCMKSRTDKADEIHDYYIKLEELINETVGEESEDLRMKLANKDNESMEIKEKLKIKESESIELKSKLGEQQEVINQLKKKKNKLYIGHTPIYKNLVKIGITEDLTLRIEQHRSSNPKFEYLFTYESDNVVEIENLVKVLLKNWRAKKPEWFSMSYDQLKHILDFVVMMYDTYNVSGSIENLITFVMKYNKNRLVNKDTARQYFLETHYNKFINDCVIITNDKTKTPLCLIIEDFEDWVDKNNIPSSKVIRNGIGNLSTSFTKEIKSKLENIVGIKSNSGISIQDKARNMNYSKVVGWVGLELKSTYSRSNFFDFIVYEKFVDKELVLTDDCRNKVVVKKLITYFLEWTKNNNIISSRQENIQGKGKYSNLFQTEFIDNIIKITEKPFSRSKTFKGVAGIFTHIFIKGHEEVGYFS